MRSRAAGVWAFEGHVAWSWWRSPEDDSDRWCRAKCTCGWSTESFAPEATTAKAVDRHLEDELPLLRYACSCGETWEPTRGGQVTLELERALDAHYGAGHAVQRGGAK